jgi:hypothetical protein
VADAAADAAAAALEEDFVRDSSMKAIRFFKLLLPMPSATHSSGPVKIRPTSSVTCPQKC